MVERCNTSLKSMITAHVRAERDDWDEHLWAVVAAYNATEHQSTGFTPFFLFHSRCEDPRLPTDLVYGEMEIPRVQLCPASYAEQQKVKMVNAFELASQKLRKSATTQARAHDLGGLKVREYRVGDLVWKYYPPYANQKLGKPWTGPWTVLQVRSPWQVRISLDAERAKSIWVNAACLKPVHEL